jgi:uncharacterized repeat protein (TIGR03803 family)
MFNPRGRSRPIAIFTFLFSACLLLSGFASAARSVALSKKSAPPTSRLLVSRRAEKVLHNFNGKDGYEPKAGLIFDPSGNLYGTTIFGGTSFEEGGAYGYGTVFELRPKAGGGWAEKVLYSFCSLTNCIDGDYPSGLIFDTSGNLYGTTSEGGAYGGGTVFELTPKAAGGWAEKVLYSFNANSTDGYGSLAGLVFDASGNIYGTTYFGGASGNGTVFELMPKADSGWVEKVLYSFNGGTDGNGVNAGLIIDALGNLYGTTSEGGTHYAGTVFRLTHKADGRWTEKILHNFGYYNGKDGSTPNGSLILDARGNLYGTTYFGGDRICDGYGCGAVFELTPKAGGSWTETVLHNFNANGKDGYYPQANLIFDASGNLYSTTYEGGGYICGYYTCGTAFELTPKAGGGWTEKVLHRFCSPATCGDGIFPLSGLIFDASGNLYGTTAAGGAYGFGAVFEITP